MIGRFVPDDSRVEARVSRSFCEMPWCNSAAYSTAFCVKRGGMECTRCLHQTIRKDADELK